MKEQDISNMLRTDLYGYLAQTMIVRKDGTVLGRYISDRLNKIDFIDEIIQRVPQEATGMLVNQTNQDGMVTFVAMIVVFICFFIFMIYFSLREISIKNEEKNHERINALAAGMNGHVSKPIDIAILLETVKSIFTIDN